MLWCLSGLVYLFVIINYYMKLYHIALLSMLAMASHAQQRTTVDIRSWQFSRDSVEWQSVRIPHDWAIAGPFDKKWDLQNVAIEQNGEKQKTEKSGRSGALPWIGEGFYRTTVSVDKVPEHALLCFDGAMAEPRVMVNGRYAGYWPYGYNTFRLDVTNLLRKGENTIDVHLQNVEESSRWYPGAGLFRPVQLVMTGRENIDSWESFARTVSLSKNEAVIDVQTRVAGAGQKGLAVEVSLVNPKGYVEIAGHADVPEDGNVGLTLSLKKPQAWSPESPFLYDLVTRLYRGNKVVDETRSKFGVRTVSVSKEHGFQLNGVTRKVKGVCLHHDLGPLGSAVNKAALIRQIRLMKEMGADAIRTSHNMPSQMQMDVCDSMGIMVMAESFDMWVYPKCKNGYARFFKEWSDKDMENLVKAHRNHPSIVMWSIGNEIPEQGMKGGVEMARRLQDICHRLDPSRPVTQGCDRIDNALKTGFIQAMDVPGFNYRVHKYKPAIGQLPQGFLLGSETASTVSSRGVYKFPVTWGVTKADKDGQVTAYDTEWCSWSNLPEEDFLAMDDYDYTIGQFVWTGIDYLGEPTPYDEYWPSRSSYFGICDLAGLPKDRYYLYRSQWNTNSHTLHLLPHWTWPGREGKVTPVFCYTDAPEAELFVNGKSQGRIKKQQATMADKPEQRARRYRLMWNDVKYEPGELRVVAYGNDGKQVGEKVVRTAGKAAEIALSADREWISADGEDLVYVTVSLLDKDGNEIPTASDQMEVSVEGAAAFRGVCNGDATSLEVFTSPTMRLFNGKLVVTLQALDKKGKAKLTVTDKTNTKIAPKSFEIEVR